MLPFSVSVMRKRRVLLVRCNHLFGESVEMVLRAAEDVEVIGPWKLGEDIHGRLQDARLDAVVIADEDPQSEAASSLTAAIVEEHPELSVIQAGLTENLLRVLSIHSLPASGADLLDTIRHLPAAIADTDDSSRKGSA